MRLLKRKIEACSAKLLLKSQTTLKSNDLPPSKPTSQIKPEPLSARPKITKMKSKAKSMRRMALVTKNLVKNFGRAIANFAASSLAMPYIPESTFKSEEERDRFIDYCLAKRDEIQTIESFKDAYWADDNDEEEMKVFKKTFQRLAEVFMRYFSVNWIFTGRMRYKEEYLKFRGALLRRILDPEAFIYIFKRKN
jgi:hypothetical protein